MSQTVKYNIGKAEKSFDEISKMLKSMENNLQKIRDGIQTNILDKSNWDSQTADYYLSQCQSLFDAISDFTMLKNNVDAFMDTIKSNYRATTEKTTSMFQNIFNLLGGK